MDRSDGTRARILAAARSEFAELGVAGARVDSIAATANINKQRIYAYFGDKEQLFDAVLTNAFERLTDAVPLPQSRRELVEYASRVFDFHVQNPDFNRLLAWEALAFRTRSLPGEDRRQAFYASKVRNVTAIFPELDEGTVAELLFALVGLAAWPVLMAPMQRLLHGLPPGAPIDVDSTREAVSRAAEALVDKSMGAE